eukprot:scaffold9587_cov23-Cyclotella_meneghiniana.AAC.1
MAAYDGWRVFQPLATVDESMTRKSRLPPHAHGRNNHKPSRHKDIPPADRCVGSHFAACNLMG